MAHFLSLQLDFLHDLENISPAHTPTNYLNAQNFAGLYNHFQKNHLELDEIDFRTDIEELDLVDVPSSSRTRRDINAANQLSVEMAHLKPGVSLEGSLACRKSGYRLAAQDNGKITGKHVFLSNRQKAKLTTRFQFVTLAMSVMSMRSESTGNFVCMGRKTIYQSPYLTDDCVFYEKREINHFNTYRSLRHQKKGRDCFITVVKKGKVKKRCKKRTYKTKSAQFLPMDLKL